MICPICDGKGLIVIRGQVQPCEDCGGQGRIHCCEGLQAQPEPQVAQASRNGIAKRAGSRSSPRTASAFCGKP